MKHVRHLILRRIAAALKAENVELRKKRVCAIFTKPISPKVAWLNRLCQENHYTENKAFEKWAKKALLDLGPRLLTSEGWLTPRTRMQCHYEVPPLSTIGELAAHLHLGPTELEWFSDLRNINPAQGPLQHYRYRWISKHRGGSRLIMEPKESLKICQRRILTTILDKIPPHPSAHGFRKDHSIRTYAQVHLRQKAVLHLDLGDFFPSITFSRVRGLFTNLGFPQTVATHLAGLTTHAPSSSITSSPRLRERHLPQGAPSSPALANLMAYRLDLRLNGLAKSAGLKYSRYADDLAFSGNRIRNSFSDHVGAIILEEGFFINPRKTRLMKASTRQHLTGVVINQHLNIRREEFDRLKATLHNCKKHGPMSQGVEKNQLRGKIASIEMLNPQRAAKLLAIFDQISWD